MKRSREVTILVDALIQNGLLEEQKSDRARYVVKEAIKGIRKERYIEKKSNKQDGKEDNQRGQKFKRIHKNCD